MAFALCLKDFFEDTWRSCQKDGSVTGDAKNHNELSQASEVPATLNWISRTRNIDVALFESF